jgi:hypothetical protein
MQQGAAEPLDQVGRAAIDFVGAVDCQIDLPVRHERGQQNAQPVAWAAVCPEVGNPQKCNPCR